MSTRAARSPLMSIAIDRTQSGSLQTQIFDQVRDAILTARLVPGTKLPATRVLASELEVSRNTILGAFERLHSEGYIEGSVGSGTRVSKVLPEDLLSARARAQSESQPDRRQQGGKLSQLSLNISGSSARHSVRGTRAFRPGLPDLEHFPFQLWSRLIAKFWRHPPRDILVSGDLGGYLPLRESIAAYLGAVRGVRCSVEQIIITSGAQQALDLTARCVIDPGDDVWVENPGYEGLRGTLLAAGAKIAHVPVDDDGLSVCAGRKLAPDAVLAAVTPSHQYPLGVTMSLSRRLELLDWAAEAGAWVLEDDYDSEFRYGGKPLSALQGLDETGRVIYVGTFSKVLFPSLRLGYLVVPEPLLDGFLRLRGSVDDQPALALQPALHAFIEGGHFASHIRRLRRLYEDRQNLLVTALNKEADGMLNATPHDAGMHLVASIDRKLGLSDKEASTRAASAGLIAPALSDFYNGPTKAAGLTLGYAGLTEREIKRDVKRLVTALAG
jgi:GntR family transcriptional regulator / MocR family aminotransferase